jgi:formamidopyrimidine-DNA glycosylase
MPELPEVEHARRIIERIARGRRIARAACTEDLIVFEGRTAAEVEGALAGCRVEGVHRRGKYLWLVLDRGPHPVVHLGMTGTWRYPGDAPLRLSSSPKAMDHAWPPRFTKVELELDDGAKLAFTNARRLGRFLLRDDPPREPPIAKLGFDPLLEMPSELELRARLAKRRGVIKGLLLDQTFAAGVGNWIADEVLYQAGIDPRRQVESLREAEVEALRAQLEHVVTVAVAVDARKEDLPADWLFHRRWGKDPGATTEAGDRIEHITVAGRTTAWVPSVQR